MTRLMTRAPRVYVLLPAIKFHFFFFLRDLTAQTPVLRQVVHFHPA